MAVVFSGSKMVPIKIETSEKCDDGNYDVLDHITLRERLRMLFGGNDVAKNGDLEKEKNGGNKISPILSDTAFNVEDAEHTLQLAPCGNQENGSISLIPSNIVEFEMPIQEEFVNVKLEDLPLNDKPRTFSYEDELDHMSLQQRKELLILKKGFNNSFNNLNCLRKTVPLSLDYIDSAPTNDTAKACSDRRKRKKTATNSVETALQEDAPGLLKILLDKGITMDEMKLYGGMDDSLDLSSVVDSFGDLENVISKLFSERPLFPKFAPAQFTNVLRRSYCLACLISLVEQARYLEFRKWPVEWGWCRDLQSFIFVFKQHNRIVMERPEYGYATYFFELVDSLPIQWQIKRLVIALKVTSCSRAALIENKTLLVGEDLIKEEARVLEEYGWAPNTGIGSMLNYRDRVYHDRGEMQDDSEWRSKIGELLMKGLNAGHILLDNIPKKAREYSSIETPNIKTEV